MLLEQERQNVDKLFRGFVRVQNSKREDPSAHWHPHVGKRVNAFDVPNARAYQCVLKPKLSHSLASGWSNLL